VSLLRDARSQRANERRRRCAMPSIMCSQMLVAEYFALSALCRMLCENHVFFLRAAGLRESRIGILS
jgi:hypothetical protein